MLADQKSKACRVPRLLLTAAASGSGKTTVTCAVLRALLHKKLKIAAFKSGPDYIDPMFHTLVVGAESRNLDLFLMGREAVRTSLAVNSQGKDLAVIEGAMGYYDGRGLSTDGSAYDLAVTVKAPVILIVNGRGAALSQAALIKGFRDFRPDSHVRGVIMNNLSPMVYGYYKDLWERETGLKMLGCLPPLPECHFGSRHLGLITAGEIQDLDAVVEKLAAAAEKTIDLPGLLALAGQAESFTFTQPVFTEHYPCRLAVAMDPAFCFYYQDALDLLERLGASVIKFSPLADKELPACDGLYLGGGYPELYAAQLEANQSMRASLKKSLAAGLPCFAECGGFMYLLERFQGKDRTYDWVGFLPGSSQMTKGLRRFGYVRLTTKKAGLFGPAGTAFNAHEFHYSESTDNGSDLTAYKAGKDQKWDCAHTGPSLMAGYPHLHLCGQPQLAVNFLRACHEYAQKHSSKP